MVGNAMTMPLSLKEYFDPAVSTFNPANVGFKFYVYGVFPVVFNKVIAIVSANDNYNAFTIQGRLLSAFFDILTLILVYKIAVLLCRDVINHVSTKKIGLWSAFFYAVAVFPIQLSHFFAVDTFLVFFMIASFYFALRTSHASSLQDTFLSAIFFGLALACKISAIYILPLNVAIIFLSLLKDKKSFLSFILNSLFFVLFSYLTLRLANPYYFDSPNFLNLLPNKLFIENIKQLTSLSTGEVSYPPAVQWFGKGPLFLLINTAVFGVGIPYFIFIMIGIIEIIFNFQSSILNKFSILKLKKLPIINYYLLITVLWVIGLLFYQSTQFVKSMRYTIYLYPFFVIFAGIGSEKVMGYVLQVKRNKKLLITCYCLLITSLLIWPLMFSSIYMNKHSRVEASEWIYQNLESGSLILSEHWDDGLPLPMSNNLGKQFTIQEMPVFDPDSSEKWQKMDELLTRGDYYILSSNRAWGSVSNMPEKYPKTIKFYNDLFANKTNYKLVKEFTSYPSFSVFSFQFSIDDQWAEELFTVYDHPKVMIFKNQSKY